MVPCCLILDVSIIEMTVFETLKGFYFWVWLTTPNYIRIWVSIRTRYTLLLVSLLSLLGLRFGTGDIHGSLFEWPKIYYLLLIQCRHSPQIRLSPTVAHKCQGKAFFSRENFYSQDKIFLFKAKFSFSRENFFFKAKLFS